MSESIHIENMLLDGLTPLQLNAICEPLLQYLHLLNKWNVAYNLTAVRDLPSMVSKHAIDSLAILQWVQGNRILDVGTGAGLPGIPLAIALPTVHFTLLDSNGKKTRFLHEVKRQLGLKNVDIVQSRVENFHPDPGFDTVISRAFSNLEQMLHWTQHVIAPNGLWLAMKGRYPDEELTAIHQAYRVERYTVAGVDGERCCVLIENTTKE